MQPDQQDERELRMPPSNIQAEQSVLGAMLLDNDAIDRIGGLAGEHFYRHDHRLIFAMTAQTIAAGQRADLITIADALTAAGKIDDVGGFAYLNQLCQNTPSSANIARYAQIVRDRALKRAVISVADELAEKAFSGEGDAKTLLDDAGARLEKLAQTRGSSDPVRAGDDMPRHLELVDARTQGVTRAIATGFGDLDRRLNGGIRRGQVVVVAARPKMGKTAFALAIARHVAVEHSALVLSMEMPRAELHDRNLSALGRVDLSNLLSARGLVGEEWHQIIEASTAIEGLNLYLDDVPALRLIDVRMKARLVKRRHGLDLVVIDYLQLMEGQGENRNTQIEGITRGLKALAKELDVGIVLLSQLNRKLEERPDKRPNPGDLRDSGSIEQDADIVIFLYRDEVYHPDSAMPGVCEVNVCLNRSGEPGREALTFIGHQVRFESHAGPWQAPLSMAPRRARPRQFQEDA